MTDNEFLILKAFNDNKDKLVSERSLNEQIKHLIGWQPYWKILSKFRANDFLIDDPVFNTSLSPVGQNAFNKENARRIQQDKDEQTIRTKLYHDAFISKWQAKSFWWVFLGSFIIGSISLCGQLGLIPIPHLSIWTTKQSENTSQATDPVFPETPAVAGQTTNISKSPMSPIRQTNTHDTLTNDKK